MKRIYIIIIILALLFFGFLFLRSGEEPHEFIKVERGTLSQEVFESGVIKKGEEMVMGFKESGRIESVLKEEGEVVEKGEIVASQGKDELEISLREAKSNLSSAKYVLDILLEGATKEEREIVESAVRSAETSFLSAKSNLEKQEKVAEETTTNAYKEIPALLGEVFLDTKEAKEFTQDLADKYFTGLVTSETVSGRRSRDAIRRSAEEIEKYRDLAVKDAELDEMDLAMEETKKHLRVIVSEVDNILDVAASDFYKDRFEDSDIVILRGHRRIINGNLSSVESVQKAIAAVNAEIDALLSTIESQIDSAKSSLDQARKELSYISADPRESDIRIKELAVDQMQARVELLERRVFDTQLRSPFSGTISAVLAREGEVVAPGSPIMKIVPDDDFYIEVNIYEGDMSKISLGDNVSASFLAFEEDEFWGEVVSINPVGRVIDGIVYYPIKITLESYPDGVMTEMTVDVSIITAEIEDTLYIPERAIFRRDGKSFVRIFENGEIEEKEIRIGLRGEGRRVEVVSGLEEGANVLIE